jgi:hydroxymethylglutaryl-CoA lyase
MALTHNIKVRGYLSTCFGCPFEGAVDQAVVVSNIKQMLDLGVYEVSLGDTIGIASAGEVESLLTKILSFVQPHLLAGHFHDTRGQALVNILKAFEMGLTTFDSSIGGLGGCPYAPGATGNVATEDVVYLFNSLDVDSGLNLEKLQKINGWLSQKMGRPLSSRVSLAGISRSVAMSKRGV